MCLRTNSSRLLIGISAICFAFSCSYYPKEKRLTNFEYRNASILSSVYKINGDTVEFKRFVKADSKLLVQHGQLFTGQYAIGYQRFSAVTEFEYKNNILDSLSNAYQQQGFASSLIDDVPMILFIQIVPDSAMTNLQALGFLNLRQRIEGKIDASLQDKKQGEWFAGDMGAGANMLFAVTDWDAQATVLAVLTEEQLHNHVLIAKRIVISKDDWQYEIIHPTAYEGVFNSM